MRVRARGETGAQRIHDLLIRMTEDGVPPNEAVSGAATLLRRRSSRVTGMNMLLAGADRAWLSTEHDERHAYYTPYETGDEDMRIVASAPFHVPGLRSPWQAIPAGTRRTFERPT